MIGYLLFFQALAAGIQARPSNYEDIFNTMYFNDPHLNPNFDLHAFRLNQLNLHNHYRRIHRVPKMTLDPALTREAQGYAEDLAATGGELEHCIKPRCDRHGAGENLAGAWGAVNIETNATKAWYDEIWDFNYCHNENLRKMHRPGHEGKPIGHFTQLVWRNSVRLGIGYARTADRTGVYIVARYKAHGNVPRQYNVQVTKPAYLMKTFQNNCRRINGGYSGWSSLRKCTQSCGGGVRLQKRKCRNPKPSLNGRDCVGPNKKLAAAEWCNVQPCEGEKSHRDLQCEALGYPADAYNFGGQSDCQLHCYQKENTYMLVGTVEDGTHCNSDSGVCVLGVCQSMPKYVKPLPPSPTDSSGARIGSFTKMPNKDLWKNKIVIPNGVVNFVITNRDPAHDKLLVGYETPDGGTGYNWGEDNWMDSWVDYYGSYETTYNTVGVTYKYKRLSSYSTITIPGPVQPTNNHHLAIFINGTAPARISWRYGVTF
ncbi:A disintegrin and metalloproteinase with thrombospondin motifs 18-like [Dendronephthya gigantea]|uniref:A disintegrin and metalloproteinase with thrombospondin motifs 18-like n=1 Tax=Dendronephthya gigantea TaxID=151771 RepID=UPI00106A4431|nr:A disintegrin and metalloproteinase with thrombospondin motifs 18-like [Dendronephthya gigantea]